jgi:hypothetical protein
MDGARVASLKGARGMNADPGQGTIPERLIVLEEAPDGSTERFSAEGLLRSLAAEGNIDAKEAIAFLAMSRTQRRHT